MINNVMLCYAIIDIKCLLFETDNFKLNQRIFS